MTLDLRDQSQAAVMAIGIIVNSTYLPIVYKCNLMHTIIMLYIYILYTNILKRFLIIIINLVIIGCLPCMDAPVLFQ